ncbi:MAG TPA: type II secretion system protein M [Aeromonadales bacterium]|nr:type II secretion system protein M [Aeromonadales bacterium]
MFWQPVLDWYHQQTPRDQQVLKIGAVALIVAIFYFAIANPLISGRDKLEKKIVAAEKDLSWMMQNAARFKGNKNRQIKSNQPASQIATQSAKKFGIVLTRVQPKRNNQLGLWLDTVKFNDLMLYLEDIQQKGLGIDSIDINKSPNPGFVKVTLTVSGGV